MSGDKSGKTAIALYYDGDSAPRVTARGRDELAEEIIALARASGVPLHEDAELARMLAQIDLGKQVPRDLYVAVAEVIAFAYVVLGKFPKDWKPPGEK